MSFAHLDLDDQWPPPPDDPEPDLDGPRLVDPRTLPARIHHLKAAGVSGAHCLHSFQRDGEETLARRLGSGTHALLLGKPCVTWEEPSEAWLKARDKALKEGDEPPPITYSPRSGKNNKWVAFQKKHTDAVILNRGEMAVAQRMIDALLSNGPARAILQCPGDRIFERTILWAQCGRARRSTPDLRLGNGEFNCEIKTTRCAAPSPWAFGRDAERFGYHAQLADQAAAIKYETGQAPRHSFIIAVESGEPHVVQVYEVPPELLDLGAQLCARWLERLQIFEATNTWSGYSPRIETLEFPPRRDAPLIPVDEEDDET